MTGSPGGSAATDLMVLADLAARVARELGREIEAIVRVAVETVESGGKLLFCGNGGSAADAQHLATEYVVRFQKNRRPMAAIALTTDTSLLTAAANDYGFEHVFARQVLAVGRPGDLLFLHSTSGQSPNLLRAAEVAREQGVTTVALLAGGGGTLAAMVDHALIIPTDNAARAQEVQLAVGHAICRLVEEHLHARD